ncbi:MAG: FMN-binding protein [Candidatus Omnitrophota bacterium]
MRDIARFSFVLFLVCLISAGFLALIFKITEPRIIEQRRLAEKRAIEEVLPFAPETIEKIENNDLVFYEAKDSKGNLIAYVFITQARGYSSDDIRTVVSLNPGGDIIAAKILEHRETPGIGTRIEDDQFLAQFKDKNISEQFDTITGATVSSGAVINSIRQKAQEILRR